MLGAHTSLSTGENATDQNPARQGHPREVDCPGSSERGGGAASHLVGLAAADLVSLLKPPPVHAAQPPASR
jgi:hypothetical protein